MNEYRILMCDDFNGQVFTFAIIVNAGSRFTVDWLAHYEFPQADTIKIDLIKCCGDDV